MSPYINSTIVNGSIAKIQDLERFTCSKLWFQILAAEFSSYRTWHARSEPFDTFDGENPHPLQVIRVWHFWRTHPDQPTWNDRVFIYTIALPHQSLPNESRCVKHIKFQDAAYQAALLVLTIDFTEHSDRQLFIIVATELVVMFYTWSGRELEERATLQMLSVNDPETGKMYSGPLHVVNDAQKVHVVLQHIRRYSETELTKETIE